MMYGQVSETAVMVGASSDTIGDGTEGESRITGQEDNTSSDTSGNDSRGSTAISSTSSGNVSKDVRQTGDSEGIESDEETVVYEGVTSENFNDYAQDVQAHLDGLTASTLVLVIAVWTSVGILAVGEIAQSLRGRNG